MADPRQIPGMRRLTGRDIIRLGDWFLHKVTGNLCRVTKHRCHGMKWSAFYQPHYREKKSEAKNG